MTSSATGNSLSGSDPAPEATGPPDSSAPDPEDASGEGRGEADISFAGRPRVVDARIDHEPGSRMRVTVALERRGRVCEEQLRGVGDDVMALRLAAEATIAALDRITGRPGRFALVGIKTVRAFDADIVLVCVRTTEGAPKSLMGSVPATGDLTRGAAMAVLHATNRLVERLVPPEESR